MSQKANYFKLGLFVIGAVVALILVLVIIGTGRFFERRVTSRPTSRSRCRGSRSAAS